MDGLEDILSALGLEDDENFLSEQKALYEAVASDKCIGAAAGSDWKYYSESLPTRDVKFLKNANHENDMQCDLEELFAIIISELPDRTFVETSNGSVALGVSLYTFPFECISSLLKRVDENNAFLACNFLADQSILKLLLSILSSLCHYKPKQSLPYFEYEVLTELSYDDSKTSFCSPRTSNGQAAAQCWNKGVGYSSGDTRGKAWNQDLSEQHRQTEETYTIKILKILTLFLKKLRFEMPENTFEMIVCSCLFQMIIANLRNDSMLDILKHCALYEALFELVQSIAVIEEFKQICDYQIASLVERMRNSIVQYEAFIKKNNHQANNIDENTERLIEIVKLVAQKMLKKHGTKCETREINPLYSDQIVTSTTNHEDLYLSTMKPYQFDTFDLAIKESAALSCTANRSKRLAQEIATLSTSLPLSYSSSIFVRCDTERLDLMKALIIGPEATPYENGCFEFDITFPQEFPAVPPVFTLKTNGNGTMRFNPNLYENGYVCLSILNTWTGSPEERWNEKTSTLLQILVSIQSLILVPEPYYNEPGNERRQAEHASSLYNRVIKEGTLRWAMLEMLLNPPACFKDVIYNHFYLKKDQITARMGEWRKENQVKIKDHCTRLEQTFSKLQKSGNKINFK